MKRSVHVLLTNSHRCRLATINNGTVTVRELPLQGESSPAAIAHAVHELLRTEGNGDSSLSIALGSEQCLSASISLDSLPRSNRRSAMVYRLEEKLPLAAEDLAADFVMDGTSALGVAILVAPVQSLVQGLEAEGILVSIISPASMLAVQHQPEQDEQLRASDVLLWSNDGPVEIVYLHDGKPAAWYVVPEEVSQIRLHLGVHARRASQTLKVCSVGLPSFLTDAISQLENIQLTVAEGRSLTESALLAAGSIEQGTMKPWFNLRKGELATGDPYRAFRRPLSIAVAALVLWIVCLSGMMLYRAWTYEQIADQQQDEQLAIFREVLPGQVAPASVISRLISEERKLRGLSGDSSDLPPQPSALTVLAEALGRLPTDLRYRVLEMRFGQQQLYLEGQALSHSDADAIAVALRKFQGFTIEPPKTEQLADQGIAFTLAGTSVANSKEASR